MTVQQLISLALLIWNLVVFVIYGLDKGKARKQAYRIPEKTLMAMAIFFGGLGAWAGGHFFHHKTQKLYFKLAWLRR
uniref:DUF1294 domain-containing protein n=1 Tax=Streptococcus suis TaxID=1307 RepID=UPI000CF5E609